MERRSAGGGGMIGRELGDIVLSWTLEDILDRDLFAGKVNLIPSIFQSLNVYLESYIPPLLEETREELSSCFTSISDAPSYKIQCIEAAENSELYYVDVDCSSNESIGTNNDYKPRNGDIYILSSIKPEAVDDFRRYGMDFCMVLVSEVTVDDVLLRGFKVKAAKHIDKEKDFTGYRNAIFLTNIMINMRIWSSLHFNTGINSNFSVIESVLHPAFSDSMRCNVCSLEKDCWFLKLPEEVVSIDLNESQVQAVTSAVSTVSCRHSHFVKLIWGPPGTGKTKTVCAILWAFLHMKCRVLTCAPTNIAVAGVCSLLIFLVKEFHDNMVDSSFTLADMVLFGSKDQMNIDDKLQVVYLEHRVEKLVDCFSLMSGWKHRISAMIDFFEDCALQYESYLETISEEDGENFFLNFIRKQFNLVSSPLEACLKNLCIHLPRSFLSKAEAKTLLGVIGLLENLRHFIFKDDASNDEMQAIFSRGYRNAESSIVQEDFVTCELGLSDRTQLEETRRECLNLLKYLRSTLTLPYGVSENWIKRFCLGNASLIFCTASSAFFLHFVEMGPLDVLIVDEAAQLRESETIIPLRLNGIRHAILVGDEIQLQSMVKSQVCKSAGYGLSLFERLVSLGHPKHLLRIQYRMHPSISLFPNVNFYGKQILDGLTVRDSEYGKHCSGLLFGSYAFVNITDGREELDDIGGSLKNTVEVAVVLHLIKSIFKSWKVNGGVLSIGVIAPYSSQVKAIMEKLGNTYDTNSGFGVRVNSVDGFQGGEDDIIILSTVRCNKKGSIGFLGDIQRMNVALTRARHCLWILGNAETLFWSGTKWEELVHDAKKRRCFFQASEMESLARLILHVKCEFDQLDDLFNSKSVLNSSMWKVLFSANFRKSFAKLKSVQTKKEVIQTMLRLADGWRSKRNNVTLSDSFQLAKIYRVREHYLVWTIDIVMDERYIQVIKIWDILLLSQLISFTSRIDRIFSMYTDSYISRCKEKCTEGNIEVPVSWNNNEDILRYKKQCELELTENTEIGQIDGQDVLENSKVSESLLLMKFYALTSGIASHLLTANDGTELSIPFELTDEEKLVVRFSRSSFILGRSGTGKTTILTTKLVQKQQQHTLALQGVCVLEGDRSKATFRNDSAFENDETLQKKKRLKQVFITVSPKLCLAIQDHVNRLTSFAASGCLYGPPSDIEMRDTSDLLAQFLDIPDTFHDLPNKHYPLVITFSKFLMMLDGSMSSSFFRKFHNDRDLSINGSSPSKFLALQMFFQKEVDFEKFVGSYWPHFSTQLTKKLDACSVYTEIISHIKGDLEAGSFLDDKLGRRDYIMLANKRVSPFCEDVRGDIYDIFLDYEKKKCLNGEFDIADFVIDLHQRLRCDVHLGDKFDYVYVDEVQDLTMRQVALLKYVCTNYDEGFVFAGDTAQTIARGVDFRFEDIRCLFYKEFTSELRIEEHGRKKGGERIKDNFQLNQNFRTHSGVLKLAKSIMDLLFSFFPLSIDRIAPETSLIYGESPVLLKSSNDENAIITIFGNTTGECCNMIEFGAEQVILVRDDCAKRQIVNLVGTKALVLTIIECKGLEFQDVLLYNFFGGSPLKNKWRVVYEYMNKIGFADQSGMTACPNFDHGRHGLLCSELKQLYVAITRTRQRLWITENSNDYCKPIFDYWKSLCLVQVRHLDSSIAQAMQSISTPDDWRVRGIKLFNEENFEMATMCFERAGDIYREKWARAAGLVSSADSILSSKPEMAESVLRKAADIYELIGKPESAAACYIKLKDFNSAGRLYLEKCGESSLEAAGDCFSMVEKWLLAADVYAKAKCFSKCLSMCSQGALFDAGLRFIKQWNDDSDFDKLKQHELCKVDKSFLESCVMHYVKLRDITHMVELAKVLQSMDLIRNSLKSRGLLDELLELEKVMGNYIEAADLAHFKGNILLEADMLQKAGHFEKSAGLILLHVIVNSLWAPGSEGWPLKKYAKKEEFLDKAKLIAKQVSDSFYDLVSSEAYLLSGGSKDLFNLSRHLVKAHKYQNIRLEIFTLREIIDIHLQFEPCKYIWEPGLVSDVDKHTNLIMSQNICSVESLMHNWKLWKNKILKVLSHLRSSSMQFKENDFELYQQFCFEYLGILMNWDQNTFFLLNPEASWTNSCKSSPKLGNLPMINFGRFKESAYRHWRLELLSLGMEILEKLESLISFSKCCVKIHSCSETACNVFERKVLFPFSKARVIFAIYDIVKFIRESDTITLESIDKINRVLASSSEYFFSILFPIRWKDGSNVSMLDFHTSMKAREFIEESINRDLRRFEGVGNFPTEGKMTLGQITRLVMLLFLTGDLKDRLFDNIIQKLSCMPPWHDMIITFKGFLNSSSQSISLILKLEQALRDAFFTDWKGKCDFMSPHCFMYIVDCLLFCASSCLGSTVPFFSTKSTLFEMLRCRGLKGYMDSFVSPCDSPTFNSVHYCLSSICEMIQMLLEKKGEIKAWVMQSSMCQFDYCSLITKMVVTLCLANLNSGRTFYLNKFLSHTHIIDDLPEKFRVAMAGCWEVGKNLIDFSNALSVNQDSLVYVISRDKKIDFSKLNAIVLKPEDLRCCENVIAKLFPKISRSEPKRQCEQELSSSISSGDVHNMCQFEAFAYNKSLIQAEIFQKNEDVDLTMRIDQDDLQKTCLQLCIDLNTRLRSYDEIKLDDIIHCLSTLIAWISHGVQQREGDPDIHKIRKMVIEIKFHSSSIDGGIEPPCMTVEELELRCPGWKLYLISFIDSMLNEMNQSSATVAEVVEEDICKGTTDGNSSETVAEAVEEYIFKETTDDIADTSSETVAEVVVEEDGCKETAAGNSSSAIKEAERANDASPDPQNTNKTSKSKGNVKKPKQNRRGKCKKRNG